MHYSGEIPQIHHTLAFFDPSQTGNSMILAIFTPLNIKIEPENDGLVQIIFPLPGVKTLRLHVNLPGV